MQIPCQVFKFTKIHQKNCKFCRISYFLAKNTRKLNLISKFRLNISG